VTGRDVRRSRRLSWLLRHGADEAGLAMDAAGWASVADVLALLDLEPAELERVVAENDKGRLELDGDRIRACQGHSTAGTPVEAGALEASWALHEGDDDLWHGTSREVVASILRDGLHPARRTHVHLADARDSRVGKRARVDVLLRISASRIRAAGHDLYRSPNGVVLARAVPADAIIEVVDAR
jgi:putative RNA 2'-phosphotransferase